MIFRGFGNFDAFGRESHARPNTQCPPCRAGEPDCPWSEGSEWPSWCLCMFLRQDEIDAFGGSPAVLHAMSFPSYLVHTVNPALAKHPMAKPLWQCLHSWPVAPWTVAFDVAMATGQVVESVVTAVPKVVLECGVSNPLCAAAVAGTEIARGLVQSGALRNMPVEVGAFIALIADGVDLIKAMVNWDNWKEVWLWERVAGVLYKLEALFPPGGARDTLKTLADALSIFARPVKIVSDAMFASKPIMPAIIEATDLIADRILKFKPSELIDAIQRGVARQFLEIRKFDLNALGVIQKIGAAITGFRDAAVRVEIFDLGNQIANLLNPVINTLTTINDAYQSAQRVMGGPTEIPLPPDEQKRQTGPAVQSGGLTIGWALKKDTSLTVAKAIAMERSGGVVTATRVGSKTSPKPKSRGGGGVLVGAVGGALVGGVPGALIGAAGAALLGKK